MPGMKNPKYTPGPWSFNITQSATDLSRFAVVYCGAKGDGRINEAWSPYASDRSGEVTAANARLMAASPELYEALQIARMQIVNDMRSRVQQEIERKANELILKVIDKALSKAEGES